MAQAYKVWVFAVTFWAYMTYHCSRSLWSYVQQYMRQVLPDYDKEMTGYVNVTFLFFYGFFMNIIGTKGGQWNLKHSVAIGSFVAGGSMFVIAILGLSDSLNIYWVFLLMAINGAAQSTGWPSLVAIMGNWYQGKNIGLLLGVWAGNQNLGDVLGLLIGDIIIQRLNASCYWAVLGGAICFWMTTVSILFCPVSPADVRIRKPSQIQETIVNKEQQSQDILDFIARKEVTFWNAWLLPGVFLYALGFVCLKGTYLGLINWLPTYLQNYGGNMEDQSSYITQMYDYGTLLGGIMLGQIGDHYGMRAVFMFPCLIVAAGCMLIVRYALESAVLGYYFVLFFIGVFQGGPYNVISGVIAIELADTPELLGNKRAIALLTAMIDGSGTIVSALLQSVIPYIPENGLFLLFTLLSVIAALTCGYLMKRELKRQRK